MTHICSVAMPLPPISHVEVCGIKVSSLLGLGSNVRAGHRHDQELWKEDMWHKNHMGMTCIVTGGGGGITSEATPNPNNTENWYGEGQYGFYDLTISKTEVLIESINYNGELLLSHTIYPK